MSKKQEPVSPVIPNDYCIMILKVAEEDITEIGVIKVNNSYPIISYFLAIKHNTESIDEIIQKVLEIIGTDTIYYMNTETEIELLKSKCESMQIPITNELLNAEKVVKDWGIEMETITDIACNNTRATAQEIFYGNETLKAVRIEQKYFIANCLDLRVRI